MREQNPHAVLAHLNHPCRLVGLTLDEGVIATIGMVLLVLVNQKLIVLFGAMALVYGLRKIKKNRSPRFLVVLMYWCLPQKLTRFVLPNLPDSAKRFWKNQRKSI